MPDEVLEWMAPRPGMVLVDGTVGAGGHARLLAEHLEGTGRIIGLDRDPAMLSLAAEATRGLPVTLVHAAYDELGRILDELGLGSVDGILLDLGLSSDQLAWDQRGFSFVREGPLDMRFDPEDPESPTASELLNRLSEGDLADLIYEFGEERYSRRIARRIVEARRTGPIRTTTELADLIWKSYPGPARHGSIHPATRTFQALRIAVNRELDRLDSALEHAVDWLKPGGRLLVISFHSLEDRRVKTAFRQTPGLTVLTKKPITPTADETRKNPRARSAKMRVAERCRTTTRDSRMTTMSETTSSGTSTSTKQSPLIPS